jgi:peptidoglycan hydrolase CwlO-like protein
MAVRHHIPSRALLGAVAALCTLALAVAPVHADTAGQLKQAKADLHSLEARIAGQQAQIDALHAQAEALAKQIDQVQTQQARTHRKILGVRHQIQDATGQMNATQGQLDERAWVAYEQGVGSNLEFILGSTSLTDLTLRLQILDNAAQSDRDLIDQLEAQKLQLQERKSELGRLEAQLEDQEQELAKKNSEVQSKLAEANAVQAQLNANLASAQEKVHALTKKLAAEQAAAEAARLAALKKQESGGQTTGGGSGNWVAGIIRVCPVPGSVFSDDFGAPRYGGGFHPHQGNDMMQSMGAPIYAPFAGTVQDATNGLGGLGLYVYGADGYAYNAHLSRFVDGILGSSVSAGTVIGYVGQTGDATAPHDHFEWHPNVVPDNPWKSPYGFSVIGSAVDPYPYISAVC